MSSIISDIFYGSKQNILDNYLINRNERHPESSLAREQPSAIYTSFIQLVIQIPNTSELQKPQYFKVTAEMGAKTDENMLEIPQFLQNETPSTILTLNDLEKADLNRYTNIKITISEGKYKNKVFGYIPIESIKSLINYSTPQKMVTLQMKGKRFIGFSSIQCTIRADFPNNNILNSQILRSMQRDYSSLSRGASRDASSLSKESNIYPQESLPSFQKQTVMRGKRKSRQNIQNQYERNIYIQEEAPPQQKYPQMNNHNKKYHKLPIKQSEYEIKSVKLIFYELNINQGIEDQGYRLQYREKLFQFGNVIEFRSVSKEGLHLTLLRNEDIIGKIYISPLLLTLSTISGELPVHSPEQQCLGTVAVRSQQHKSHPPGVLFPKNAFNSVQDKTFSPPQTKSLFSLNLQKILLINSAGQHLQDSLFIDPLKADIFNFSKIQSIDKLELLVRIDAHTFRFDNLKMRFIVDRDAIEIVQINRKEGFFIHLLEPMTKEAKIQIELYSNLRLLSYGCFYSQDHDQIERYFIPGVTEFQQCQSAFAVQIMRLQTPNEYFTTTTVISRVIQSIMSNTLTLKDTSDASIKVILNHHKKATYVQTKKLFLLLKKIIRNIVSYQQSSLIETVKPQRLQTSEQFIKFTTLLLRELKVMDRDLTICIEKEDFDRIVKFYTNEYLSYQSPEFQKLKENVVLQGKGGGKVIYPFFVAGMYYLKQDPSIEKDNQSSQLEDIHPQKLIEPQIPSIKELALLTQPTAFISKLFLQNIHLLNNGKIPNVSINLSKKVHYSNASPEFILEKDVNLMQTIQIYHKNIARGDFVLLAEFQPNRRQIHYELDLTGKARAKIQWGC